MLIPGVVALVLWLVASGYLVVTGFYDREVASTVRKVSIPAVTALSSVQRERELSIQYVSSPTKDTQSLTDLANQRRVVDQQLSTLRSVANSSLSLAPASIKSGWSALTSKLDQLPSIRSLIDADTASEDQIYNTYDGVLDSAINLFDVQARVVPDVTASQGGLTGIQAFRASDQMSWAGSIITGALGSRELSQEDYLQFVNLVGAYHAELADAAPHLIPAVAQEYSQLTASPTWKQLDTVENELITDGPWTSGMPKNLTVSPSGWQTLASTISTDLDKITIDQADQVSAAALHTGNDQLLIALLGSLLALILAVGAIIWAVRQSRVLVDRALSTRLAQLGQDAATVVDERLPRMLDRLRSREKVDLAVELPNHDYGSDEIGQLAEVLNRSLQVAVGKAVDEAATREAGLAMLMGVARRPQSPLQHGLQVIEDLQSQIGDEKLLADLFDVNHQLAQTRRFLENLIIVAGGQTGRRFARPVPVRRVLLAATAETQQYQRVRLRHTADVDIVGGAVAGTTHLLAELIDNALVFSPPKATVWVSCTQATRGVVVEIEDAGLGMVQADLERANDLLAHAPAPDIVSLRDGSQVGLWVVAELSRRLGIQVTLRPSAYGGLLAVVLLPERLIASESDRLSPEILEAVPEMSAVMAGAGADAGALTLPSIPSGPSAVPSSNSIRSDIWPETFVTPLPAFTDLPLSSDPAPQPDGLPDGYPYTPVSASTDPLPSRSIPATLSGDLPSPRHDGRPPLPERKPQQHLAPELRDSGPVEWEPPEPLRTPEENQLRFAQYQQGWRAGLAEERTESPNQD